MFTAYLAKLGLDLVGLVKSNALMVFCILALLVFVLFAKCSPPPQPKPLDLSAVEAVVDAKVRASEARLQAKLADLDAKIVDADDRVKKARRALR